ncbi:hypothetical protein [Streptomyces sp. NPDC005322]|uniref:hypothetical protein n=1 Tax=unclassified Streptomyces TaxID=2593676 RepID=UPI0033BC40B0
MATAHRGGVLCRSRISRWLVNAIPNAPGLARFGEALAGVAARREAPPFAQESFIQWWRAGA